MTETTHTLSLPYILPSQAQKHVTHNEALRMLDAIVQPGTSTNGTDDPPASPGNGERHIIGDAPTGAWTGHALSIAAWQDGAWMFYEPQSGWLVWSEQDGRLLVFDGSQWTDAEQPVTVIENGERIGINTTADTTNRLAVSAPATLLSHDGASHQLKLNKSGVGDTASLLFQTGFSARAEIGLTGDDDFHFKVSPDGSTFHDGVVVDKDSGAVRTEALSCGRTTNAHGTASGWTAFVLGHGGDAGGLFAVARASNTHVPFTGLSGWDNPPGSSRSLYYGGGGWGVPDANLHLFYTASAYDETANQGTERMRITKTGRVGVGTPSPTTTLHVSGPVRLGTYTVATVPSASASGAGSIIYVSDETGGAVSAFSDGTDWRRMTDRAVIS